MKINDKNGTLNVDEAAAALGVSVSTIRNRVKQGAIKARPTPPLLKQPARLLFDAAEIEKHAPRSE